jgi:hypothetical protein
MLRTKKYPNAELSVRRRYRAASRRQNAGKPMHRRRTPTHPIRTRSATSSQFQAGKFRSAEFPSGSSTQPKSRPMNRIHLCSCSSHCSRTVCPSDLFTARRSAMSMCSKRKVRQPDGCYVVPCRMHRNCKFQACLQDEKKCGHRQRPMTLAVVGQTSKALRTEWPIPPEL